MSTTIPVSAKKEQSRDTWSDDRFLDRLMDVSSYGMATVTMLAVSYWHGFFLGALASGLQIAGQLGIFFILEPIARGHLAERQVRRLLARLNVPAVHDIFVRTPDGRQAQLDHVAFLGQAIAVIETKSITGVVTRTGSRWSHLVNGVERGLSGRSPQQQALNARDVLRDAYPSWRPTSVALTVLTHGELGTGFQGDAWVVKVNIFRWRSPISSVILRLCPSAPGQTLSAFFALAGRPVARGGGFSATPNSLRRDSHGSSFSALG